MRTQSKILRLFTAAAVVLASVGAQKSARAEAEAHWGFGVGTTYLIANGATLYGQSVNGTIGYPLISVVGSYGIDWVQARMFVEFQPFFGRTTGGTNMYAFYSTAMLIPTFKLGPVYLGPGVGIGNAYTFGLLGLTAPFHPWVSATLGLQFGRFFIDGRVQLATNLASITSAYYTTAQVGFFIK